MTIDEILAALANGSPVSRDDYSALLKNASPWNVAGALIQRFDNHQDDHGLIEALYLYQNHKRPDLIDRVLKERAGKISTTNVVTNEIFQLWQTAENQLAVMEEIRNGQPMNPERHQRLQQLAPYLQGIGWAYIAIRLHNYSALQNCCDCLIEDSAFDVMLDVIKRYGQAQDERQTNGIEYFRYIASMGQVGRLIWQRVRTGNNINHQCENCGRRFEDQRIVSNCDYCHEQFGITNSVINDVFNPPNSMENELPGVIKLYYDELHHCYWNPEEGIRYPEDAFFDESTF